jgi:hypothetical protein
VAALLVAAVGGSAVAFARAPAVTALEQGIINGNLYQAADSVLYLQANVQAMQAEPVQDRDMLLTWKDVSDNPGNIHDIWVPAVEPASIREGVAFIGDSVALGANRLLSQTIRNIRLDSKVSRSLSQGKDLLKEWAASGYLDGFVVISLGANGYGNWQTQIDAMVEAVPTGQRLIFVTPFLGKPQKNIFDKEIAAYFRKLAETIPWITVADWAALIQDKQELLAADKIHFGNVRKCSQLFVDCVLEAISEAGDKPVKL